MVKKNLTTRVGIPTCYGGESLVETIKTLRASTGVGRFPIAVVADRTPIPGERKKRLRELGVNLIWNKTEGSQFKKIKQLVDSCREDIFISTQDDITFQPGTVRVIQDAFDHNPKLTMIGVRILPLAPLTHFESAMGSMLRMVDRVASSWRGGDNRLAASGRCLAFRTSHLRKFRIPQGVVNGDMFLYLENKRLGGTFRLLPNAAVFIRAPQRLKDQIGPSSRYQFQKRELARYFDHDVSSEYRAPWDKMISSLIKEFFSFPIETLMYTAIYCYTRLNRQNVNLVSNPVWSVDESTKQVLRPSGNH